MHPVEDAVAAGRMGLAVTPLTAAVLAVVPDADLGQVSAIDAVTSRLGCVIAIAVVPALIGGGSGGLAGALTHGDQPAVIVLGGVCAAAALVTWLFVSDTPPGRLAPCLRPPSRLRLGDARAARRARTSTTVPPIQEAA